jgi:hypothetical protein
MEDGRWGPAENAIARRMIGIARLGGLGVRFRLVPDRWMDGWKRTVTDLRKGFQEQMDGWRTRIRIRTESWPMMIKELIQHDLASGVIVLLFV